MKATQLLLQIGLASLVGSTATLALADEASTPAFACQAENESTLTRPLPMTWHNSQEGAVNLVVLYKNQEGNWIEDRFEIPGQSDKEIVVLGRCLYWYGKRGNTFFGPNKEKTNLSEVIFTLDGYRVPAIGLDLMGREGKEFTFNLL